MISSIWEKVSQECTSVKSLGTHGGPTQLEGLVSAVLRSGYPVYTKKKGVLTRSDYQYDHAVQLSPYKTNCSLRRLAKKVEQKQLSWSRDNTWNIQKVHNQIGIKYTKRRTEGGSLK
uniref:Uncharacterized protein n=1 Tax=Medicago truncatula TaxID=3880 RepID=A2Q2E6_MEDTR|nr:hypothetical protein MtrDRAFT_AC150443g34v2 [Medicago truncatula]